MTNALAQFGLAAAWLVNFFCFSTTLIVLALCADRLMPKRWGIRMDTMWKLVIPVSLLGATLLLNPEAPAGGFRVEASVPATQIVAAPPTEPAAVTRPAEKVVSQFQHVSPPLETPRSLGMSAVIWSIYMLAVLLGFWRIGRDYVATRALFSDMGTVRDPTLLAEVHNLAETAKIPVPDVVVTPRVSSPATLIDNTICLPEWALSTLEKPQMRSMLAHEIAHVARRDVLHSLALRIVQVLLPVQPLLLIVRRRVAYHAELACDDWAASMTGGSKALAQTLGCCAENLLRPHTPLLAAGMADSPIVERVRRLTASRTLWPTYPVRTVALMLIMAALCFAVVPGIALSKPESSGRSVEVIEDDSGRQRGSVSIRNDERKLKFKYEGAIVFAPSFNDVEQLDEDGLFRLSDDFEGTRRKLELHTDNSGTIKRKYEVDGRRTQWNAEAQLWFQGIIELLIRETGMALDQRMAYLLSIDGADSVIDEIRQIKSDHVMRRYVVALSGSRQMTSGQLTALLQTMEADLQSDFEQRTALSAVWVEQQDVASVTADLLAAAATIQSDFEARSLAEVVARTMPLNSASVGRWLELVESIQSDFEMRSALVALLDRRELEGGEADSVMIDVLQASELLQSDFEHRSFLVAAAPLAQARESVALAYARACSNVQSDFEMSQAILALVEVGPPSDDVWLALLELVRTKVGGHEAAQVLVAMAPDIPATPELNAAFDKARAKLRSHDQSRVNDALSTR